MIASRWAELGGVRSNSVMVVGFLRPLNRDRSHISADSIPEGHYSLGHLTPADLPLTAESSSVSSTAIRNVQERDFHRGARSVWAI